MPFYKDEDLSKFFDKDQLKTIKKIEKMNGRPNLRLQSGVDENLDAVSYDTKLDV
jgi:hypothetical protein